MEAFLSADSFAVVGASRNRSKFGNKILRCCEPSSVCSCVPARYASWLWHSLMKRVVPLDQISSTESPSRRFRRKRRTWRGCRRSRR
eukprot:COSAG03_NODE_635_length_6601_cov_165.858197_7_plen_87_part_00